jgi:hypothetical protein
MEQEMDRGKDYEPRPGGVLYNQADGGGSEGGAPPPASPEQQAVLAPMPAQAQAQVQAQVQVQAQAQAPPAALSAQAVQAQAAHNAHVEQMHMQQQYQMQQQHMQMQYHMQMQHQMLMAQQQDELQRMHNPQHTGMQHAPHAGFVRQPLPQGYTPMAHGFNAGVSTDLAPSDAAPLPVPPQQTAGHGRGPQNGAPGAGRRTQAAGGTVGGRPESGRQTRKQARPQPTDHAPAARQLGGAGGGVRPEGASLDEAAGAPGASVVDELARAPAAAAVPSAHSVVTPPTALPQETGGRTLGEEASRGMLAAVPTAPSSPPSAMQPASGVIFGCMSSTYDECFDLAMVGLPRKYLPLVSSIVAGHTLIFLFNFSNRQMHGVYIATSDGQENLSLTAWKGLAQKPKPAEDFDLDLDEGSPFPAQCSFGIVEEFAPVPEAEFKHILEYTERQRFKFKLSKWQCRDLVETMCNYDARLRTRRMLEELSLT